MCLRVRARSGCLLPLLLQLLRLLALWLLPLLLPLRVGGCGVWSC